MAMYRICALCFIILVLSGSSCKTVAPSVTHYAISIMLDNDKEAINKVLNTCIPLELINLEVLNVLPLDSNRVLLKAGFIKNNEDLISKVRAELYNIKG